MSDNHDLLIALAFLALIAFGGYKLFAYCHERDYGQLNGTEAIILEVGGCSRDGDCGVRLESTGKPCTTTRFAIRRSNGQTAYYPVKGNTVCVAAIK